MTNLLNDGEERRAEAIMLEGFERRHWQATGLLLFAERMAELNARLERICERLAEVEDGGRR